MFEKINNPFMEAPAHDFFRDRMPSHSDTASYAGQGQSDVWNPEKEDVNSIPLLLQLSQARKVRRAGEGGFKGKVDRLSVLPHRARSRITHAQLYRR